MKNPGGICHPGFNVKQANRGPSKFTTSKLYLLAIRGQFELPVGMGSHDKFLVCHARMHSTLVASVKEINMSLKGRFDYVSNAVFKTLPFFV